MLFIGVNSSIISITKQVKKEGSIMKSEIITLKNKIETLFINAPGSTSACVQIWFRAGSALEEGKDKGIAHFLEHMFF